MVIQSRYCAIKNTNLVFNIFLSAFCNYWLINYWINIIEIKQTLEIYHFFFFGLNQLFFFNSVRVINSYSLTLWYLTDFLFKLSLMIFLYKHTNNLKNANKTSNSSKNWQKLQGIPWVQNNIGLYFYIIIKKSCIITINFVWLNVFIF